MGEAEKEEVRPAEHFGTLRQETHAQRLGMWVFLASEVLLFSGLYALYSTYRAHYGEAFDEAIRENTKILGSINTLVLLTSSLSAALGVGAIERGRRRAAMAGLLVTILFALTFLVIKGTEYHIHWSEGYRIGGAGMELDTPMHRGVAMFFSLYYLVTGIHAVHVIIGTGVLSWLVVGVWRRRFRHASVAVELGVLYWHLVDIMWIFIWPLFYLIGGR